MSIHHEYSISLAREEVSDISSILNELEDKIGSHSLDQPNGTLLITSSLSSSELTTLLVTSLSRQVFPASLSSSSSLSMLPSVSALCIFEHYNGMKEEWAQ